MPFPGPVVPRTPEHLQHRDAHKPAGGDWRPLSLDEVRKLHILCQGNRLRAAEILGIGRRGLDRYLKCDGPDLRAREKSCGEAA
jgi:hypothetical protein